MYDFTTKLPELVDFGNYDVALTEIQYPQSWFNATEDTFFITVRNGQINRYLIPPGKYDTIDDLLTSIKHQFDLMEAPCAYELTYNKHSMKITLTITGSERGIRFSTQLSNLLGLEAKLYYGGEYEAKTVVDVDEGLTALFIYSDIVQSQIVGDVRVPLMRIVPIEGDKNERYKWMSFAKLRYLPTIKKTTDIVRLYIYRDNGTPVSFKSGKVIANIHLRPKK